MLGLDNLSEEQLIENYLNNMRLIGTWTGSIEIEAITNMLNTNIMRNNELFYLENQNKNEINHIYIYYINHNHYNFVLTRETNQEENKMDIDESEQVSTPIPFSSVITNTYLGQLSDNTPEIIINRISQLNPRFDLNQIYVTDIQENNAVVLPFVPPLWKGKIPTVVHFSLFQDRKKQPIIQYKNVHQDDWKTKEIDLKKQQYLHQ
ncbi:hypothetical protein [Spiroplasma endosymbiont of Seladonia tumulorum]|uniref:OTU domain-containing protein n=1 Tax=Spiroplasma endosymbiont of Seladonia tumulorum TaxID=3066321 RepID=UPI0030CBDA86